MTRLVLFVCTANQCRSPMAEVLARAHFAEGGLSFDVASAGELEGGQPATRNAEKAMASRGLDLSQHVSRQLDADIIASASLILTMERRHLGTIGEIDLDAIARTFPLAEFVRLAPPRPNQKAPEDWVAEVNSSRDPRRTLTLDSTDDVPDPIGRSMRQYQRCAETLATHVSSLAFALGRPLPGAGA